MTLEDLKQLRMPVSLVRSNGSEICVTSFNSSVVLFTREDSSEGSMSVSELSEYSEKVLEESISRVEYVNIYCSHSEIFHSKEEAESNAVDDVCIIAKEYNVDIKINMNTCKLIEDLA